MSWCLSKGGSLSGGLFSSEVCVKVRENFVDVKNKTCSGRWFERCCLFWLFVCLFVCVVPPNFTEFHRISPTTNGNTNDKDRYNTTNVILI